MNSVHNCTICFYKDRSVIKQEKGASVCTLDDDVGQFAGLLLLIAPRAITTVQSVLNGQLSKQRISISIELLKKLPLLADVERSCKTTCDARTDPRDPEGVQETTDACARSDSIDSSDSFLGDEASEEGGLRVASFQPPCSLAFLLGVLALLEDATMCLKWLDNIDRQPALPGQILLVRLWQTLCSPCFSGCMPVLHVDYYSQKFKTSYLLNLTNKERLRLLPSTAVYWMYSLHRVVVLNSTRSGYACLNWRFNGRMCADG